MTPDSRKAAVAWLSVLSNTTLVLLKVVVGFLIGSVSVISEAIHSGVDLVASVIALLAVKASAKPADARHPFGHGKFENVSGTVEALLIFAAAGWIVYEAVHKILQPVGIDQPGWGVGVMVLSAGANLAVSHMLFKVGRQTDSLALKADAWHLRTDVYTSIGVTAGLGAMWFCDRFFPHLGDAVHLIDPLAALVVAALILRAAWNLTVQSTRDLVDVSLPEEEEWIRGVIQEFMPRVHAYHRMRTRKAGAARFADFHILVDGQMTVEASHKLAHEISGRIKDHFPNFNVTVHIEPCDGTCPLRCRDPRGPGGA